MNYITFSPHLILCDQNQSLYAVENNSCQVHFTIIISRAEICHVTFSFIMKEKVQSTKFDL